LKKIKKVVGIFLNHFFLADFYGGSETIEYPSNPHKT